MASNIADKVDKFARQSRECRQFHDDLLSDFMQSNSINIRNSSLQDHHDAPKSSSILSRSPARKTLVAKNSYANIISHSKEDSSESLDPQEKGSMANNVDLVLNKWKLKLEGKPQSQIRSVQAQQQIEESKATDKINRDGKISLNQSSLSSDSISFNISESVIGGDQRKSRISEKENAPGESNISNFSVDKPPIASTVVKDKNPVKIEKVEKSLSPAKNVIEEVREHKITEPKNEKGAPEMLLKTVKSTDKEIVQDLQETRSEPAPGKKPQFQNTIKSKISILKNMYAGRDPVPVSERDTKPVRQSPKQEEKVKRLKNKNIQTENYEVLSPHRESNNLNELTYSKIDFEGTSEISFTYSPENSIILHDHGRGKENQLAKVINPQQVIQKMGKIEWNEHMEKEFEMFCLQDPEIMKLRNKINSFKSEIALASL